MQLAGRAGVVVTGTEVLSGRITDRNGPWLAQQLRGLGLDVAQIIIVGDEAAELRSALEQLAALNVDLIATSGGLGPTADDMTTAVVAEFSGAEMVLDKQLEERIDKIVSDIAKRFQNVDREAMRAGTRKQAHVPAGATVLEPVGTAPGVIVEQAAGSGPTTLVLPGPPSELKPMWADALSKPALLAAIGGAVERDEAVVRIVGVPESELAADLRKLEERGVELERLELTTCLRRGELEIAVRAPKSESRTTQALISGLREFYGERIFTETGETIDAQIVRLLAGQTLAVAESCTGGELATRLSAPAGASEFFLGGVVAYSNFAKEQLVGVDAALIEQFGAVSEQVADALAVGAVKRFGADFGIGVTGIAGPTGGTDDKPVGTVCFSVASASGTELTTTVVIPGDRASRRDRATTAALHLLRRVLI